MMTDQLRDQGAEGNGAARNRHAGRGKQENAHPVHRSPRQEEIKTPAKRLARDWPEDDRAWLMKFIERIRTAYPNSVKDLIIYGSMARGDWHPDSDIDVLMVLHNQHHGDEERIEQEGHQLTVGHKTLASILSMTESQWDDRTGTSFHNEVTRDGVKVL